MTSPAAILAKALEGYEKRDFADLVKRSGVSADTARRAKHGANGQATNADSYLRLCAVIGIDPDGGKSIEPREPSRLLGWFFAIGLKGHRLLQHHTQREAAAVMQISATSISRMENGDVRSFAAMLAACRYMGMHPFDYLAPDGFTENSTGKPLKNKAEKNLAVA